MKRHTIDNEKNLADYIIQSIKEDYLLTILVSSYTQAKIKSDNLPFGVGKTTIAMRLSHIINGHDWNKVFDGLCYNPVQLGELLRPNKERLKVALWDDVQFTAPAAQGVPKAVRQLANYISTNRPELACLIMTAPNINSISAPLRRLVTFEVIVVQRGIYEVQKISYHKNYKNPQQDRARLRYIEELSEDTPFAKLPPEIQIRYDKWRAQQKQLLYPNLMKNLQTHLAMKEWDAETLGVTAKNLSSVITKGPHDGYYFKLPRKLGEKLHQKNVTVDVNY